jgi:hypothetical protein
MKLSKYIEVVKPKYVYFKLIPNNSIKNNGTYKIAKAMASLYRNIFSNIKKEEAKIIKMFGREFLLGTRYSIALNSKIAYFIYIEKKKVEFYFIIPEQYLSIIKEKISDSWGSVTIARVDQLPQFKEKSTKYQLVFAKEDGLSLASDRRNNDLIDSNLNIIDVLDDGDRVGIYYNFMPVSQFNWPSSYRNTTNRVKLGQLVDRNKMGMGYLIKSLINFAFMLINELGDTFGQRSSKAEHDKSAAAFEQVFDKMGRKVSDSTAKKGRDTILNTQILILSESPNKLREQNNTKSLVQSFEAIAEDNTLKARRYTGKFNPLAFTINKAEINKCGTLECSNFISLAGREILERYNFIEKVETQETEVPEELRQGIMGIGSNKFRGKDTKAYLSNDREYKYLTLVLIGPTRAGKTTLIGNLSSDAINNKECAIIFDYVRNCELSDEISALFPKAKTLVIDGSDFTRLQGLGYNEVPHSSDTFRQYDNAKKQATQLMTLVNSINADDTPLTAKMERYLTSAALVVFISRGSIGDVFNVLQHHKIRRDYLYRVPDSQKGNLDEYINSLRELDETEKGAAVGTKTNLIIGIIDRLQKLKANTYMELMLKKGTRDNIDLVKELQKNQLITIKMPESMFMTDNERDIYCTYWITKLWMALQIRSQLIQDRAKLTKVNLIIDELYQVENTERFLTEKLSRLAKFGLKPILSCHYLNQIKGIREELRSANASYMLISGCDKKNYDELKSELYPFTEEDLLRLPRYNSMNLIKYSEGYAKFITKLPKPISN